MRKNLRINRDSGYALMLTLILTMIIALLAIGAARSSLRQVVAAGLGERQLQIRWGSASIDQTLLPRASRILTADPSARDDDPPLTQLKVPIQLGDVRFDIKVADEQAKVNVNAMLVVRSRDDCMERLRSLLLSKNVIAQKVWLPLPSGSSPVPMIEALADCIDGSMASSIQNSCSPKGSTETASDCLTCWSDGRLNILLADREAIDTVLRPELDLEKREKLLKLRSKLPSGDRSVSNLLNGLELQRKDRELIGKLITDHSSTFSIATSWNSPRGCSLSVGDVEARDQRKVRTFHW